MKKRLIELVLAAVSLLLVGVPAPAQPPAEQTQTETAPKPESSTAGLRIGAAVGLLVIIGIIVLRRKGKKKTDDEF